MPPDFLHSLASSSCMWPHVTWGNQVIFSQSDWYYRETIFSQETGITILTKYERINILYISVFSYRLDASHSGAVRGQKHQGQLCHPVSAEVFRSRPKLWAVLVLSWQVMPKKVYEFFSVACLPPNLCPDILVFSPLLTSLGVILKTTELLRLQF